MTYTKATIALHDYLRTTESSVYCPLGFVDGEDGAGNTMEGSWRNDEDPSTGLEPLGQAGGNRYTYNNNMIVLYFNIMPFADIPGLQLI